MKLEEWKELKVNLPLIGGVTGRGVSVFTGIGVGVFAFVCTEVGVSTLVRIEVGVLACTGSGLGVFSVCIQMRYEENLRK